MALLLRTPKPPIKMEQRENPVQDQKAKAKNDPGQDHEVREGLDPEKENGSQGAGREIEDVQSNQGFFSTNHVAI